MNWSVFSSTVPYVLRATMVCLPQCAWQMATQLKKKKKLHQIVYYSVQSAVCVAHCHLFSSFLFLAYFFVFHLFYYCKIDSPFHLNIHPERWSTCSVPLYRDTNPYSWIILFTSQTCIYKLAKWWKYINSGCIVLCMLSRFRTSTSVWTHNVWRYTIRR